MSEENRETANMDKRFLAPGRQPSLQVPSKANEVGGNASKYSAQGSKKDFNSGSRSQNDAKKFNPRSSRGGFDKRSKQRGCYGSGTKEEVAKARPLSEEEYETRVLKKGNLNHMLNFYYDPVHGSNSSVNGYFRPGHADQRGYSKRGGGGGRKTGCYNKECFLQANCQFVVKDDGDYSVHAASPDTLVDWGLIEQVRVFGHEVPSCPICLYPPKAAKITRCGHIYCWPCVLHYLSLEDKSWRKCPICYESIHEKDLKSVTTMQTVQFNVDQTITMKLMKKERGQMYVAPRAQWHSLVRYPASVRDSISASYSKLLTADERYIEGILDDECEHLQQLLNEEPANSLEASYVRCALENLDKRRAGIQLMQDVCEMAEKKNEKVLRNVATAKNKTVEKVVAPFLPKQASKVYLSAFDDEEGRVELEDERRAEMEEEFEETFDGASVSEAESSDFPDFCAEEPGDSAAEEMEKEGSLVDDISDAMAAASMGSGDDNALFFYQAADGQHIYMHPLNVQCLKKQYGCLSLCPLEITAKIVELEAESMNEDTRKRLRYLSHLPLTCEFQLAELDLKPPLVSEEVLTDFETAIQRRCDNRKEKDKKDKMRARRIQKEENKRMGIDPTVRIVRSDYMSCQTSEMVIVASDQISIDADDRPFDMNHVGSPKGSCSSEENCGGQSSLSFAQMLRMGKAKPSEVWPKVGNKSGDFPTLKGSAEASKGSDGEDGGVQLLAPEFRMSFVGDLERKLADLDRRGSRCQVDCDGVPVVDPKSNGKKKKAKTLLFSTSMARNK